MAGNNLVLCLCCNQRIPRQREREHRKQLAIPTASNSADSARLSRQRQIVSVHEDVGTTSAIDGFEALNNRQEVEAGMGASDPGAILQRRWGDQHFTETDSDAGSDIGADESTSEGLGFEDEEDETYLDWAQPERELNYGLSSWDRLGEGYEAEAVSVGAYFLPKSQCRMAETTFPSGKVVRIRPLDLPRIRLQSPDPHIRQSVSETSTCFSIKPTAPTDWWPSQSRCVPLGVQA